MQESRNVVVVMYLCAAIVLGTSHRAGAADDSLAGSLIDYIVLASRLLVPPG
jgi:hypothetical protein